MSFIEIKKGLYNIVWAFFLRLTQLYGLIIKLTNKNIVLFK